jgi:aspartate carbamoyltransferase catalytic subunit
LPIGKYYIPCTRPDFGSVVEQELEFSGRDIVSLLDFSRDGIEKVFSVSDSLEYVVKNRTRLELLKDKVMAALFYEASTRTRLSFECAMLRLGGAVTGFADARVSRAGDRFRERLADTARVVENYADVVVIRHHENGAPAEFARHANVPVISGGDGTNEHPTQGLLDLYTVKKELGEIDGKDILISSDMKNERAVHSLLFGLAKFDDVTVYLLAPDDLKLSRHVRESISRQGLRCTDVSDLNQVIGKVDVVYSDTIIQPTFNETRRATPDRFILNASKLEKAKDNMIVLHPLPRLDELSDDVDMSPHAKFFEQTKYGVITRMALLCLIFGRSP